MKKLSLSVLAAFAVAGTSFAGPTMATGKDSKDYKGAPEAPTYCFNAKEFSLDVFGSFVTDVQSNAAYYGPGGGGGIGLNYFFQRNLGLGIDANWSGSGPDDTVIHQFSGSFIVRFPIEGSICIAPYFFVGGGVNVDGSREGTLHGGAGLEWRATPKFGVFADGRYTVLGEEKNDTALFRAGVRFIF